MKPHSLLIILLLINFFLPCAKAGFINKNLDKKIGQMLIVGFRGDNINDSSYKKTLSQLKKGKISGVIYFSHNIKSKEDLILMNNQIKNSNSIPPFISIDNEGGKIQRFDNKFDYNPTKSAYEVSKLSIKEAQQEYSRMAQLEQELGFNLNFAPCVDLEINKNSIISKKQRSYSEDYLEVSKYAKIFIQEHNKRKIITSIKHFPGHGSIEQDTHLGFADSTQTFKKDEIMPYYKLKDLDKLNTVMISHVYNSKFDNQFPASLSKKTIKELLIDSIGYKGVIVSDDYDMGAIRKNYSLEEIIVNSINAGVNILIFSNNIERYDDKIINKFHQIVKKELKKGTITLEDIDNSYQKIINLKNSLL